MFNKKYIMYCPVCGYVDGEHTKNCMSILQP